MFFILYVSKASDACTSRDVADILQTSRQNNPGAAITGILVYKNAEFLQYLEGPEAAVQALYDKIARDDRHEAVRIVDRGVTGERVFPDWSMGFAGEANLGLLQKKWELDKIALFSFAENMDACRNFVRAFIDAPTLGENSPDRSPGRE